MSTRFRNDDKGDAKPAGEMKCRLELDMDARTATLTINGVTTKQAFSETVTSINHIGFGIHGASTLFTEPKITTH